jgi:adenosylhomocysteine nucleosidase
MEGAAIAQVAAANHVPHLIIRAISDLADNTAPDDFDRYIVEIVPVLNAVIRRLLGLLRD